MDRIYFDNAATTPLSPEVIAEMDYWMREGFGNPSSIHAEGRKARAAIEDARKRIAQYLNASIGEVFFTSCGTESSNMALKCAVRDLGVKHIISSPIEHHCVLHTLDHLEQYNDVKVQFAAIDRSGRVQLDHLRQLLENSSEGTLVTLMHANNEIGTLLPLEEVAALCSQYGVLFHSDTVQTIAHFPIDVQKTKISFLAGSAHKFHGPKGIGFIYINSDNPIDPFVDGGGQERNMRAGTENIYGIRGMAKALELAVKEMDERIAYISDLRQYMKGKLTDLIPGISFLGDQEHFLYTVLSVNFPAHPKNELLLLNLDMEGISASGGSACTSGAETSSHVLNRIQVAEDTKTIRFSFSHYNNRSEVDQVVHKVVKILDLVTV